MSKGKEHDNQSTPPKNNTKRTSVVVNTAVENGVLKADTQSPEATGIVQ